MNIAISSSSMATTSASNQAATAAAQASGSGFAGVLVQAIGGGESTANFSTGLPMASGLISLLGRLGAQQADKQPQDVLAMLTKLLEQLQNLEQSDAIPPEIQDQLAALLNSFQGLLQQIGQPIVSDTDQASQLSGTTPVTVVHDLKQTLQQLSEALTSNGEVNEKAVPLFGQLKLALDSLEQRSIDGNKGLLQTERPKEAAIATAGKASSGLGITDTATAAQGYNPTATAVVAESGRPAASLRDPVWKLNVVNAADPTVTDNQAAVTSVASAGESSGSTGFQPAWTFLQNDALLAGDSVHNKPGLPAQVPVQQFTQQMEKFLVKQFALTQGSGTTEAKLVLTPEHLGQVDVRIVMQNGHLTAHFVTENAAARDLLENQMSQLRAALHGQGLQVDRLEVVQQPSSSANMSFLQHDGRQPGSGSNRSGAGGQSKSGSYDDTAIFEAELERTSSLREFGYGSSLNVTA